MIKNFQAPILVYLRYTDNNNNNKYKEVQLNLNIKNAIQPERKLNFYMYIISR